MIAAEPGRRASSSSPTPTRRRWRSRKADRAHPARRRASPRASAPAPSPMSAAPRAEEALDEILEQLDGAHMVFITAGMGGGTGTGAAPVIARAARERGILTVGVVTKPFHFEGAPPHAPGRTPASTSCSSYVDTLIVIPNQNLFRVANERTTFAEAFAHGRRGAAFRRARRHRPDGDAGPDQPRLRRHPHGDDRDGQGDDGHRRGRRRRPRHRAAESGDLQPAARRCRR